MQALATIDVQINELDKAGEDDDDENPFVDAEETAEAGVSGGPSVSTGVPVETPAKKEKTDVVPSVPVAVDESAEILLNYAGLKRAVQYRLRLARLARLAANEENKDAIVSATLTLRELEASEASYVADRALAEDPDFAVDAEAKAALARSALDEAGQRYVKHANQIRIDAMTKYQSKEEEVALKLEALTRLEDSPVDEASGDKVAAARAREAAINEAIVDKIAAERDMAVAGLYVQYTEGYEFNLSRTIVLERLKLYIESLPYDAASKKTRVQAISDEQWILDRLSGADARAQFEADISRMKAETYVYGNFIDDLGIPNTWDTMLIKRQLFAYMNKLGLELLNSLRDSDAPLYLDVGPTETGRQSWTVAERIGFFDDLAAEARHVVNAWLSAISSFIEPTQRPEWTRLRDSTMTSDAEVPSTIVALNTRLSNLSTQLEALEAREKAREKARKAEYAKSRWEKELSTYNPSSLGEVIKQGRKKKTRMATAGRAIVDAFIEVIKAMIEATIAMVRDLRDNGSDYFEIDNFAAWQDPLDEGFFDDFDYNRLAMVRNLLEGRIMLRDLMFQITLRMAKREAPSEDMSVVRPSDVLPEDWDGLAQALTPPGYYKSDYLQTAALRLDNIAVQLDDLTDDDLDSFIELMESVQKVPAMVPSFTEAEGVRELKGPLRPGQPGKGTYVRSGKEGLVVYEM